MNLLQIDPPPRFLYLEISNILRGLQPSKASLDNICNAYRDLDRKYATLYHQVISLVQENQRLTHENDFMLRMINERDT